MLTKARGAAAAALVAALIAPAVAAAHPAARHHSHHALRTHARHRRHSGAKSTSGSSTLPVRQMEQILQVKGTVSEGVLTTAISRPELGPVKWRGVPIQPDFGVDGSLDFQPAPGSEAFFNGDIPVAPSQVDKTISAIIGNGLVFQAEHQHVYDFEPTPFFIHLRGRGAPQQLASEVHNVLVAAEVGLPQEPPEHPKTPFDVGRLKRILHGYEASVEEGGVVTVFVARKEPITIEGVKVKPQTNIATNIAFEPLNGSGTQAAALPDFAMVAHGLNPVVGTMLNQGWDIGCLYNQETDEHPQLYFSHQIKTGDPYALAEEIERGLEQTNNE